MRKAKDDRNVAILARPKPDASPFHTGEVAPCRREGSNLPPCFHSEKMLCKWLEAAEPRCPLSLATGALHILRHVFFASRDAESSGQGRSRTLVYEDLVYHTPLHGPVPFGSRLHHCAA